MILRGFSISELLRFNLLIQSESKPAFIYYLLYAKSLRLTVPLKSIRVFEVTLSEVVQGLTTCLSIENRQRIFLFYFQYAPCATIIFLM